MHWGGGKCCAEINSQIPPFRCKPATLASTASAAMPRLASARDSPFRSRIGLPGLSSISTRGGTRPASVLIIVRLRKVCHGPFETLSVAPTNQSLDRISGSRRLILVKTMFNQPVVAARPVAERHEVQPGPPLHERDGMWDNRQLFLFDLPLVL